MHVSVVIPTYNREELLKRAITSVMRQSYRDWDLSVVDDGGTDYSEAVVMALADSSDLPIRYHRTSHQGVSAARNYGVQKSDGDLIAFLDSDDAWHEDKLERQVTHLMGLDDIPLVYSAEIWIRGEKRVNPPQRYAGVSGRILVHALQTCIISPSTVLMKRTAFNEVGGFDESFPVCEDYDLWLRFCSKYDVSYMSQPLVTRYGGREDQLSRITPAMDYWRVRAMASLSRLNTLANDERQMLSKQIQVRGSVLLKGYSVRGNEEKACEVLRMIRSAIPDFDYPDISCCS